MNIETFKSLYFLGGGLGGFGVKTKSGHNLGE